MTINNNNVFGVFTLNEARGSRLTGDWLNKESVANYGWFGGGNRSVNSVDRIDFSNDSATAQSRGVLSTNQSDLAATGNSNYGWFGGGISLSKVDRIDFSNDSATASSRGPLSSARYGLAATANSNYGWFGGGGPSFPAVQSRVDRIDFSNDSSTTSPRGPLSQAKIILAATGNSNYGWFGGGRTPTNISTVDRIDFSNDSVQASPRGPLTIARGNTAATGNSNYGWFGSSSTASTVDRIDFSNDSTTASLRGSLTAIRYVSAATGNSNYGWFGGGQPGPLASVDRIDFSNDSVQASPRGSLSGTRQYHAATSGVLNIRRQKAGNFGWFGGGGSPSTTNYSTVDRIDFSNDSVTALVRGSITPAPGRYGLAATGNSNYGWFGGGTTGLATLSIVERIDFSNDSPTVSLRGPLSFSRHRLAATGNSNYGWFGGGFTPLPASYSIVDRIDFSNDSASASPRGPLSNPAGRSNLAATGNSNYGWFGGGIDTSGSGQSRVERIDFSNDSATPSPRGLLVPSTARSELAATGNSNYGWFGGGQSPTISRVDRIDFSNDSVALLSRGSLSLERYSAAATGNSNYGWFGGGKNPTAPTTKSTVDRIDFSNDSISASPRGSLSTPAGRDKLAATSNTNK
jgi:hypothetical protein